MTDADKIREAWARAPAWDFDARPYLKTLAPMDMSEFVIGPATHDPSIPDRDDVVEFRRERGLQDWRPAYRIIGRLNDTEVCVSTQLI